MEEYTATVRIVADRADRCFRVVVRSAEGTQSKPLQEKSLAAVLAQPIKGLDCLNDPPRAAAGPCHVSVGCVRGPKSTVGAPGKVPRHVAASGYVSLEATGIGNYVAVGDGCHRVCSQNSRPRSAACVWVGSDIQIAGVVEVIVRVPIDSRACADEDLVVRPEALELVNIVDAVICRIEEAHVDAGYEGLDTGHTRGEPVAHAIAAVSAIQSHANSGWDVGK